MKVSEALGLVSWASVIALIWLLLFGVFKQDLLTWGAFAFFLLLAFLSSIATAASNAQERRDRSIK